ncbi:hypothetical protein BS47DRAFT_1329651 [Hydnum rufescens UP504]|uniref:t-SNARE coiled-coil homology domain-containing protein n=1 Tax=Hydnum rufescens UP504 TaxID=1448309 RepID=A0A9P6AWH9_9AGAM|nr:hypothetical protein BS47DRAFT_1329651 [Hydnum rufescens UP504]
MTRYVDRTEIFREQVRELARVSPPNLKRVKGKGRQLGSDGDAKFMDNGFLKEAYAILAHITTLTDFLSGIRRPYLNVDSNASKYRGESSKIDLSASSSSWSNVRHLSNEERDQIDLEARLIISQCAERVSKLEKLEQTRIKKESNISNNLLKLLPARLTQSNGPSYSELITAHRSNITWYLTRRLADVGQSQKEMQEERVKRQLERARTLGSSAPPMGTRHPPTPLDSSSTSLSNSSYYHVPPPVISTTTPIDSDDSDGEIELTSSQIVQFEEENANILRAVEDMLESVQLAESRLLDISALQTELSEQLVRQTEVVDTLYDEAMTSQNEVERGNVQLRQARERARSSRKWILFFILMATFALLFLHWYD